MSQATVNSYDAFADIYNRWMANDFMRRALPAIDRLLLNSLAPAARILDLCCGTGQLARALVARGFHVTGVDSSPRMLRLARENCPGAEFVLADARSFRAPHRFDAVLSTFNSLAHLESEADLQRVFRIVRAALVPGSAFLFDVNTEAAYASRWAGSFAHVGIDHACVVQPTYDAAARTGINRITLFKRGDQQLTINHESDEGFRNGWERSDFEILQRCHPEVDVRTALQSAGFPSIRSYDAQRELAISGEWGWTFFLCR